MRPVKFPVLETIEIVFDENEMPRELLNSICDHPEEIKNILIQKIMEAKPVSMDKMKDSNLFTFRLERDTGRREAPELDWLTKMAYGIVANMPLGRAKEE